MSKGGFHPNAYLSKIKNIKRGLRARTMILAALEDGSVDAETAAKTSGLAYGVVMHHLRLLTAEQIIQRKGRRPYIWQVTGFGQKRLVASG
jgi:hypothetical protein